MADSNEVDDQPQETRELDAVVDPGRLEVQGADETDHSPPRGHPFPIVGIGGSAGALDAFMRLLEALPGTTGMAFVLVQHLDPHHPSQLAEILASHTSMLVRTVEDGMAVAPNVVFVIPSNTTMILEDGVLRLVARAPGLHLPIDAFFESLARVQGGRAIGVVLSGSAADGSLGVRAIKEECGMTFAQDESTARHIGMPRSAIATGAIDYVLSPVAIAHELVRLSGHAFVQAPDAEQPKAEILPAGEKELKKIFQLIRAATRVDFTHYKANTVRRRIGRRMIVKRAATLGEYASLLAQHPDEVRELHRDLLISVTNFFRDPEVFQTLGRLLEDLLRSRSGTQSFRVWVPGCATGEEVYSIAMLLREALDELGLPTPVQIFGTDISEAGLARARAAVYPDVIQHDVTAERLRRHFVRVDRGYQVSKIIREDCIFARQDLTSDPPFGNMDLISCRNLLIYLDSVLQRRVLPVLHYSLNPTGLLVLGSAESIGGASDLFSVVDKQAHIYGRKPVPVRLTLNLSMGRRTEEGRDPARSQTATGGIDLQKKADLVIQSKYSPPAVVIDADFQILHFRGRTGFYLEPTSGEATFNLLKMAHEGLVMPIRKAVRESAAQNVSVRQTGLTLEYRGESRRLAIEVTPILGSIPGESYFLVVFDEEGEPGAAMPAAPSDHTDSGGYISSLESQTQTLQRQTADMREELRNANEDHEAHSEELRAANEEVRSANEELQSTNEELGTTKEELQSANEELTTLNEELQNRNRELNVLNSDLGNLLSAVDVAFVMVDGDLRLRRFSAAAERYLGTAAIDIGHPLTHVKARMDLTGLEPAIRGSVESLSVTQHDLQDREGRWFAATIRPYRTLDDHIAGAVIVFVDIDPLKRMLRAAEQARDYAEGMIATVREPLVVLDRDLRIQRANAAYYETFHVSRTETEGRLLYDLGNGQWNLPRLRELIGASLFQNKSFQDFELEHSFPYIGRRRVRLNGRRISGQDDQDRTVLIAIEDVTKRREEAEVRYQRLFETAKDGMLLFDGETGVLADVNPYFLELTGFGREQLIGRKPTEMEAFQHGQGTRIVDEARSSDVVRYERVPLSTIDGRQIEVEIVANRYSVGNLQVIQLNVRDVTRRNQALAKLQESESRFRMFVESVRDYAFVQMDLRGRITSWNPGAERLLGYTEAEILGKPTEVLFTPVDIARGEVARELNTTRETGRAEDERWHVRKDGSRFFASGVATSIRDEDGTLRGFAKVMRDITDRKKAEKQLKQQGELLELAQDLIIVHRWGGTITFWNRAAADHYGWSREEAEGSNIHLLLDTTFPKPLAEIEAEILAEGRWEGELLHKRSDGTRITVWSRWSLQTDSEGAPVSVLEINSDITDRKRADEQVRSSLREKEVLLKEIHHRVKNNLQIIASLLNMQAEFVTDRNARVMLEEMNTRVRSIAAIHEMLYSAPDLSQINFGGYLNLLTRDISSVYSLAGGQVVAEVNASPVSLDITQAVPCGLIVSELLTNAFKHAFRAGERGSLRVAFDRNDHECVLEVSDNGAGLPAGLNPASSQSMGFQLVMLLVQQIKGSLEVGREGGTRFSIRFPEKVV